MGRFVRASKEKANLRCAIFGPSGSGKTFTALRIATGLGSPIGFICTERHSARKYSDRFTFDVLDLERTRIDDYVGAIRDASKEGFGTLIIDSLTHGWQELLEQIDALAKTTYKGNSWGAWSEGTPQQKRLINAILGYPGHVIATMRSKTEWTVVDKGGRGAPGRVGLAPEQGKGIEYEFDLLIELNTEHFGRVIKDRTGKFQDAILNCPGEEFGRELGDWLSDGALPPHVPKTYDDPPDHEASHKLPRITLDGRGLYDWAKQMEADHGIHLLKYLNQWARLQEFPMRMSEWDDNQVALAHQECIRKLLASNIDVRAAQEPKAMNPDPSHGKDANGDATTPPDHEWGRYATALATRANRDWTGELLSLGVPYDAAKSADADELTNIYRLSNYVASAAMEDGSLAKDQICRDDDPSKRSMRKVVAAVAELFDSHPDWVSAVAAAHVRDKRVELRARLGLDKGPTEEQAPTPTETAPTSDPAPQETPPSPTSDPSPSDVPSSPPEGPSPSRATEAAADVASAPDDAADQAPKYGGKSRSRK
jgi:hypothetical protein